MIVPFKSLQKAAQQAVKLYFATPHRSNHAERKALINAISALFLHKYPKGLDNRSSKTGLDMTKPHNVTLRDTLQARFRHQTMMKTYNEEKKRISSLNKLMQVCNRRYAEQEKRTIF